MEEEGKGTGLGLATAFGIVKQSGGHIEGESTPGRGTTFTICLPRVKPAPRVLAVPEAPPRAPGGGWETILLVEDEEVVRILEREVLERHGYSVLEASGPEQATALSRAHSGVIHLLLTDVIMPGMSGVIMPGMSGDRLAEHLLAERPEMKVIFASGYAADMIAQLGLLAPGTAFLPKPLTPSSITGTVREVLDAVPLRRAG